jgi:hypothetical protein
MIKLNKGRPTFLQARDVKPLESVLLANFTKKIFLEGKM